MGPDVEIGPPERRAQIGRRRVGPPPVRGGELHPGDAALFGAVVVRPRRIAVGRAGFDERVGELLQRAAVGRAHPDRTGPAAPVVGPAGEALHPPEDGQDPIVGPIGQPLRRPAVVIGAVAAHERRHVDRSGAAEDLAVRVEQHPSVGMALRLGAIGPVVAGRVPDSGRAEGDLQQRVPAAPARLEQQHPDARVLAQPAGEDAAGRPAPDHDVVVMRRAVQCGVHDAVLPVPGGPGRTRTGTPVREADFKSAVSTNFTTGPAGRMIARQAPPVPSGIAPARAGGI